MGGANKRNNRDNVSPVPRKSARVVTRASKKTDLPQPSNEEEGLALSAGVPPAESVERAEDDDSSHEESDDDVFLNGGGTPSERNVRNESPELDGSQDVERASIPDEASGTRDSTLDRDNTSLIFSVGRELDMGTSGKRVSVRGASQCDVLPSGVGINSEKGLLSAPVPFSVRPSPALPPKSGTRPSVFASGTRTGIVIPRGAVSRTQSGVRDEHRLHDQGSDRGEGNTVSDMESQLESQLNDVKGKLARTSSRYEKLHSVIDVMQKALTQEQATVTKLRSELAVAYAASKSPAKSQSGVDHGASSDSNSSALQAAMRARASFLREGVAEEILPVFMAVYANISKIGRFIATETVPTAHRTDLTPAEWFPNGDTDDVRVVRDWRGRVVINGELSEEILPSRDALSTNGYQFVLRSEADDGTYQVEKEAAPRCPMEVARAGGFYYAGSDITNRSLIKLCQEGLAASCVVLSSDRQQELTTSVKNSKTLATKLRISCRDNVGARKKAMKAAFFKELGYPLIAECRSADIATVALRNGQFDEAYSNLLRRREDNSIVTSWWRRATFDEVCSAEVRPLANRDMEGIDNLFGNEPARMACEEFAGMSLHADGDFSITLLCRLDAWMTALIEDLPRKRDVTGRGGTETVVLKGRYQELLVPATVHLLNYCRALVSAAIQTLDGGVEIVENEFVIRKRNTMRESLDNENKEYTFAFRYPNNNHIYVNLASSTFKEFVCPWLGQVRDCYILHCEAPGARMEAFSEEYIIPMVEERMQLT